MPSWLGLDPHTFMAQVVLPAAWKILNHIKQNAPITSMSYARQSGSREIRERLASLVEAYSSVVFQEKCETIVADIQWWVLHELSRIQLIELTDQPTEIGYWIKILWSDFPDKLKVSEDGRTGEFSLYAV